MDHSATVKSPNFLNPDIPANLPLLDVPVVVATDESLKRYGCLVSDYKKFEIEIVTWPLTGRRRIDEGTGNQGGTAEGIVVILALVAIYTNPIITALLSALPIGEPVSRR